MNDRTRWKTLAIIGIVIGVLLVGGILATFAVGMSGSHGDTQYQEVPPERGRVIDYRDGNIKHHHARTRYKRVSSRTLALTGPCAVATQNEWGDSATFTEVVRGSLHVHYCVGRLHPNRIVKVWATFDHWEWWAQRWHLNWQRKAMESPILWTTTWCQDSGYGPCYPVQRKTYKWTWEFKRSVHIPALGDVVQYATFGAVCTVRGQAPSRHQNYECYSGKWATS
jgi:hypothetical protein